MTEQCIWGSSTENPCPRPATVPYWHDYPSGVKVCTVHSALEPLRDEVNDLALAEEKLDAWMEEANEEGNRPLLSILERARVECRERKEFLEEHTKSVSLAGS